MPVDRAHDQEVADLRLVATRMNERLTLLLDERRKNEETIARLVVERAGAVDDRDELLGFVHEFDAWKTTADLNRLAVRARILLSRGGGQSDVTPRVVTARADVARVEHLQQQMGDEG